MDEQILTSEQPASPKKKGPLQDFFETVELLAFAAAIILLLFTWVARITVVDGPSMQPTLQTGEKLLVSRLFYTPEKGDIVIVQSKEVNQGVAIVKRVIAKGGDRVSIKSDGVYVNGERLEEKNGSLGYTVTSLPPPMAEIEIEQGEIFILGDNRYLSYDSEDFGPVSEEAVIGKVLIRLTPLSAFGKVN